MRAVVVNEFGGPSSAVVVKVPDPTPGPGQVRVRVHAATVNPTDIQARQGMMVKFGASLPVAQLGLGVDVAGTIDMVGPDVHRFAVGDAVIAIRERLDEPLGTQADYVVIDAWALATAPVGRTMAEAATLPLNSTTADQALDVLGLRFGDWILITGAAGAVGGFAIELALLRGLRVIGSGSGEDERSIRSLGAELFIDRDKLLVAAVHSAIPGGVHGALDAANMGVTACDAVRHGGVFASVLNNAPQERRDIRCHNVAYHADGARLARLSALAEVGRLTLRVADSLPLEHVAEAHERMEAGGVRGRLVLVP